MNVRSTLLLASAALAGVVGQANATTIYGGGSSLVAPYITQAANCFGDRLPYASNGSTTLTLPADFGYTGTPPAQCGATGLVSPGNSISYISAGSGRGFMSFFSNNPLWTGPAGRGDSWLQNGTNPTLAPSQYATKTNFAAADAGVPQSDTVNFSGDINTYLNGGFVKANGNVIQIAQQNGAAPTGTPPSGNLIATLFPNPVKTYGPAVQIPLLIAAPAVAFKSVYKKVRLVQGTTDESAVDEAQYAFGGISGTGKAKLSVAQLCGIFTGSIVNYNDPRLAGSGFTKSSKDSGTFDVPLQIVGRSDGSGTTSIVYRHLEKVCGTGSAYATDPAAAGGNAPTTLPVALQGVALTTANSPDGNVSPAGEQPGLFTRANGSGAVAKYLAFLRVAGSNVGDTVVQGRIGYLGEDFVLPYVTVNGQNSYGLFSATLQNASGVYVAPSPSTAAAAYTVLLPPQSTTSGAFSAGATNGDGTGFRNQPAANTGKFTWVSAANIASPLADPTPTTAYPMVGTTNGLFYRCYAHANEAQVVRTFLNWYYTSKITTDKTKGILALNGFGVLPAAYLKAVNETFVTNPTYSGVGKLNLDIQSVGVSPECNGVTVGAGA